MSPRAMLTGAGEQEHPIEVALGAGGRSGLHPALAGGLAVHPSVRQ